MFADPGLEEAVIAEILTLPTENYLMGEMAVIDLDAIHTAREWLKRQISEHLQQQFTDFYQQYKALRPYSLDPKEIGRRRLKNLSLMYLTYCDPKNHSACLDQFNSANNMTDVIGAVAALLDVDCEQRTAVLSLFYHRWHHETLVVNKWFSLQAQSTLPGTLKVVQSLTHHPSFDLKNPNSVRSLIGAFCANNPYQFHQIDGEAYAFLTDYVLTIERFNPQLAARIVEPLINWQKFNVERQRLMKAQLQRIADNPKISPDVFEIVSRSLN